MHVSYFPAMLRVTRGREGGVGGEKGLSRGGGGGRLVPHRNRRLPSLTLDHVIYFRLGNHTLGKCATKTLQ